MKPLVALASAVTAASLTAAGLAAPATAAPLPSAPAAEQGPTTRALAKKTFTVFGKFTSRRVVPSGNAKGIGNLTITQGTVSDSGGSKVGTLTTVLRVVAPSPKKDAELRDTQSQIELKDGQIFAQAVNEDPKDGPPQDLHIMPVIGGTGAYASARGTLLMRKVGDKYLMAYDLFVEKDLKKSTFSFTSAIEETFPSDAPQGVGAVSLGYGTGADDTYIAIATRGGSVSGVNLDSIDLQVFTATGSLLGRTIARTKSGSAKDLTFAVLGGTGTYAGYRGEFTLKANGRSIEASLAAPGGKAKPMTWFEDNGRGAGTVEIPGATFLGVEGLMFRAADKKKKSGDYFASRIEYDEIGGVTPVVTMLEQEFSTGTMIVTGITLTTGQDGVPVVRPIVGGTGDYGGAAGQVSSLEQSPGVWRKAARFWR